MEQTNQTLTKTKKIKLDLKTANMLLEEEKDPLLRFGLKKVQEYTC